MTGGGRATNQPSTTPAAPTGRQSQSRRPEDCRISVDMSHPGLRENDVVGDPRPSRTGATRAAPGDPPRGWSHLSGVGGPPAEDLVERVELPFWLVQHRAAHALAEAQAVQLGVRPDHPLRVLGTLLRGRAGAAPVPLTRSFPGIDAVMEPF